MRLKHQIKLALHLNKMFKILNNVYKLFTISILKNCKAFEYAERIIIMKSCKLFTYSLLVKKIKLTELMFGLVCV